MADPFQTYLYQTGRALYVSPISKLAPRLDLLDVLVQSESEGFFGRRPVLSRVGSMLDLGATSSEAARDSLREGRDRFWKGLGTIINALPHPELGLIGIVCELNILMVNVAI